jgi:ElaB/YqjD/DUF883 family membrane-anchored ribosome-binding protein
MAANNRRASRDADTDELARQLKQIQSDFAALAEMLKGMGLDRIGDMSEAFNEAVEQASEAVHDSTTEARERGENFAADVKDAITRNPFRAILVAFGVGYLLARLTRR